MDWDLIATIGGVVSAVLLAGGLVWRFTRPHRVHVIESMRAWLLGVLRQSNDELVEKLEESIERLPDGGMLDRRLQRSEQAHDEQQRTLASIEQRLAVDDTHPGDDPPPDPHRRR